jgi:hypothetical protein
VFWRSFGGAINGTVGIIRTMIAENVKEKKYHSRAFLILPIGFNIAALFGPVMGGMLADPVESYPRLFGSDSSFGSASSVQWLMKYPYALPMLVNAAFLSLCATCVAMGLEETSQACKGKPGLGAFALKLFARVLKAVVPSSSPLYWRLPISDHDEEGPLFNRSIGPTESYELEENAAKPTRHVLALPFQRIWTKNVVCILLAQAFFDFQMGYASLHVARTVTDDCQVPSTIYGCFSYLPLAMIPAILPVPFRDYPLFSPGGWVCCLKALASPQLSSGSSACSSNSPSTLQSMAVWAQPGATNISCRSFLSPMPLHPTLLLRRRRHHLQDKPAGPGCGSPSLSFCSCKSPLERSLFRHQLSF